ncbi:hypothetical protein D9615_006903 [Tricholomella constricta]|uniref:HMG box domain-containing protein n=1 Tax=Tricholomella constricta TaxID=117010 RepID=A0A8H5M2H6_9AGAR|nr:hypothetical protein D9615_006903 [Tricholomella constricta]
MPAVRLSRRRRSSLAMSLNPAKAGIYGISRPVTFAPNVTPVSYVEPEDGSASTTPEPSSPSSTLFPPSETPAPPPTRRRVPPGKRRSMGYIPRPPNAFMLFRADFVRQKHVPGTIETNHGSLSKIIGNCWRSLPLEEKRVWEVKAKRAKAEHKERYPEYRFRPVHNKNKEKKKEKPVTTVEDERRCEEVAQLLLEGKKGDELAAAVRDLDLLRADTPVHAPLYQHRRSSSVPLPNDYYPHFSNIVLPSAPFFSASRPSSPMNSIARQQQRMMLGNRRASSARPAVLNRSWTMPVPMPSSLQRDDSPLPEVDMSLFNPSFELEGANSSFAFNMFNNDHHQHYSTSMIPLSHDQNAFGPLENIAPHEQHLYLQHQDQTQNQNQNQNLDLNLYSSTSLSLSSSLASSSLSLPELWIGADPSQSQSQSHPQSQLHSQSESHPSTAYSGSPTPSEAPVLHAPQPQSATAKAFADMWKEFGGGSFTSDPMQHQQFAVDAGLGVGVDFDPMCGHGIEVDLSLACGQHHHHQEQEQQAGLDSLFQPQLFCDGDGYAAAAAAAAAEYQDMTMTTMLSMQG